MKVRVQQKRCCGYAFCVKIAPEIFEIDDHGQAHVLVDDVPPEDAVERSVRACPQMAIVIGRPRPHAEEP